MSKNWLLLFITGVLLFNSTAYGQNAISQVTSKTDTVTFDKKLVKDSASIEHFIDKVFETKRLDPTNAIALCTYAYNRATEIKNLKLQAAAINSKASIYGDLGNYPEALKLHYQALKMFEKLGDVYGIAMITNNIGKTYQELSKLKDALTYLKKAEALAASSGRKNRVLAVVYPNFANVYTQAGDFKKALYYALRADSVNVNPYIKSLQAVNDGNIGAYYFFLNDKVNALKYFLISKQLAAECKDMITYYKQVINIGEIYEGNHQQDPLPYYKEAFDNFVALKDYADVEYAATDLSNYYKTKGDYKLALQYYQQAVQVNQKNKDIQATRNMAQLQTQYETEKKEQQITSLNQENTIQKLSIADRNKTITIIIVLFALSGILVAYIYNRNKFKQKTAMQAQMLKQQEQLTTAVIDAEEKERTRIASDLHDGVGQLFSAVRMNLNGLLERVKMEREEDRFLAEKTVALVEESCKEVRSISHQMMPNMLLRSGIASDVKSFIEKIDQEALKVSVEANGFKNKLESNVETVLYRVIQETVNNVIKHAKASTLDIKLNRDSAGITAVITDNGIGFNTTLKDDFAGIGLKNIATRIEYLKGTVSYESSPGNGTKVTVTVPVD